MTPLCSLRKSWWRNAYLVAAVAFAPAALACSVALWLHAGRALAPFQALALVLVCAAVLFGGVASLLGCAARHAFEGCVRLQAEAIAKTCPDVVVASSFGGAVAVNLVHRGLWSGPTLLLAPAQERCRRVFAKVGYHLPRAATLHSVLEAAPCPMVVVHGTRDTIVPVADSVELAGEAAATRVKLLTVEDNHTLQKTARTSKLVQLVDDAVEWHRSARASTQA